MFDEVEGKVEKYMDLMIKLQQIWNTTIQTIPLIFGALGTISDSIFPNDYSLQVKERKVHQLQKTIVLQTATIIRRHLRKSSRFKLNLRL